MERAPRVCTTCKARKKGCDKAVPRCGYCTQRGLLCLYPAEDQFGLKARHVPSNKTLAQGIGATTNFFQPSNPFLHSSPSDPPLPFGCALHLQVLHIFHITGQSFSGVCDQFFEGYHRWLPIVSRVLLDEMDAMHQDGYPPMDFSLLVLAMYLVTLKPCSDTITHLMSPQVLYLELKMILARAHATTYPSRGLIQTGLLLASFEYTRGQPYAAYLSIGSCAQMASILGINYDQGSRERSDRPPALGLKALEERNVWWGIIVLERLISHECPSGNLRPLSQLPSQETELPSDLICDISFGLGDQLKIPTVSDIHLSTVSGFGRQAQAVYLLALVENFTTRTDQVQFAEIRELDERLREFLSILMNHPAESHRCGANGIIVRSLIRLHQYTLNQKVDNGPSQLIIRDYSHSALDTLARMMVDVAHDHLERFVPDHIDSLPLSCSYNMRSAMQLIQDRRGKIDYENPPVELAGFMGFYRAVCKRWPSDSTCDEAI